MLKEKEWYNKRYLEKNTFGYQEWFYSPYIKGLVTLLGLKKGSLILDVGCGQGVFCYQWHKCGMKTYGIDVSDVGIHSARNSYGSLGIEWIVGDAKKLPFKDRFDCVFTRSCSLYNNDNFALRHEFTDELLRYVKKGGTFIFSYNTNLTPSRTSGLWRKHTLQDVKKHFSNYSNVEIFFVTKVDALLMREYTYNSWSTKLNMFLSNIFKLGGCFVCILRKN